MWRTSESRQELSSVLEELERCFAKLDQRKMAGILAFEGDDTGVERFYQERKRHSPHRWGVRRDGLTHCSVKDAR